MTNPNYVVVDGDGRILGKVGGKMPASEFVGFLKGALSKFKEGQSTAKGEAPNPPAKEATFMDPKRAERGQSEFHGVPWGLSYEAALEQAEQSARPLLIFFDGVNDANGRMVEIEVLTRPIVVNALLSFVTVKLYTDIVPIQSLGIKTRIALAEANLERMVALVDHASTPCFAVLDSEGVFQGEISGKVAPQTLARFLRDKLDACYNPLSQSVL